MFGVVPALEIPAITTPPNLDLVVGTGGFGPLNMVFLVLGELSPRAGPVPDAEPAFRLVTG